MLAAGKLDRVVRILTVTETADAVLNGLVRTTVTLADVWAEKRDLRGREFFAGAAANSEIDTIFRIRWRSDVTPLDRLSLDGREYDIVSVAEIGRREGLEINAKARAEP